ncbi:MAG: iron ABC transporter permease [Sedimentisphaerales bacterium]|nr:iron ABC transporter permease [Sedimentisphaerales bacterium]
MTELLTRKKFLTAIFCYLVLTVIVLSLTPFVGSENLDESVIYRELTSGTSADWSGDTRIFVSQRIPRVLLGFLIGGSLALVGSVFQVIFRNPLASPATLGVTAGGAVGAVLAISVPALAFQIGPISTVQLFSLAGSAATMFFIYLMARRPQGLSMNTLLLAGVTVGILAAAVSQLIRYLANPQLLMAMDRWLMGGLDVIGYQQLGALMPMLLPGAGLLFLQLNNLNHLSLGSEMARGHGVDVGSVQRCCFVGGTLVTAAAVSLAGPIAFVGLVVPHIVRLVSGYDHRIVLPGAFLAGGSLLAACDCLARTIVAPTEMPVGIITAIIGGPFFILLLLRGK